MTYVRRRKSIPTADRRQMPLFLGRGRASFRHGQVPAAAVPAADVRPAVVRSVPIARWLRGGQPGARRVACIPPVTRRRQSIVRIPVDWSFFNTTPARERRRGGDPKRRPQSLASRTRPSSGTDRSPPPPSRSRAASLGQIQLRRSSYPSAACRRK